MSTVKVHMISPAPSVTVSAIHPAGGQMIRQGRRSFVLVTDKPSEVTCGTCLSMLRKHKA